MVMKRQNKSGLKKNSAPFFIAVTKSCSHKKSGVIINRITEKLSSRLTEPTETESKENIHSTESEEDNAKVVDKMPKRRKVTSKNYNRVHPKDLTRTQPQDSKEKWKIYAKKFANKIEVESPVDKWDKYVQKVVDKEAKKKEENSEKFDSLNDKYQQEIEKEEIERKRKELEDDSEDSDDLESDECASSDEEGVTKEVDSEINVLEDRQDCNTENEEKTELENEQSDMTVISHDILKIASNLEKQSEKQNLEFLENSLVADVNCKDEVTPDAEDTLTDKKAEGQREVKENINEETQKFGDQAFTDRSNVDRKSINNNDKGKKNVPTPKANIESYIHEKNEKGQNGERNEDDDSNKESNQNNEQEEVNNNTLDNLLNPEESKEEVNNNTLDNLLNPEESRTNNDSRLLQCTEKVETMEDLEDAILQEVALMKKGLTVRSIEVDNLIQQLDFDIT